MFKRTISVILALIICIGVIAVMPVTASAGTAQIASTAAKTYAAPKNIKVTKQDNKGNLKVTWSAVKGAPLYAVFVKVGSATSWKRVKYTSKTVYTYSGAKNATKYTFTIRVADKKGRYVSSYNKTGVSLTYNPTWSKLYKDFVQNKKFINENDIHLFSDGDYYKSLTEYIEFSLFDINKDGFPELIGNTVNARFGYTYRKIYTIKNGKVKYLDYLSSGGLFTNAKRTMMFGSHGRKGSSTICYYYYKSGKLQSKDVLSISFNDYTDPGKGYTKKIIDKTIYKELIKSIDLTHYGKAGIAKYPLDGTYEYTIDRIKSMGWNKFVKKFGF